MSCITNATLIPNKQVMVCFSDTDMAFVNLHDIDHDPSQCHFKASACGKIVGVTATEQYTIVAFARRFIVMNNDDKEVVLEEPLSCIYDLALIDSQTLALSCKAGKACIVVSYSLTNLSPTSLTKIESNCKLLVPMLDG